MPELPEVEITRRGIEPGILGRTITGVVVRNRNLRWRVPGNLALQASGRKILQICRRGKYLLLDCGNGGLIVHLGMSGSLRLIDATTTPQKHDHLDIVFGDTALRLRDPRRFGAVLWKSGDIETHPLLSKLGVEPLGEKFTADFLYRVTRGRRVVIKQLLMNSGIVVGVGNIYASESLFRAGIRPHARAGSLSLARCASLVQAVQETLRDAIRAGGSSLRDFVHSDGASGYFQLQTFVYDRAGLPCRICSGPIRMIRQGQRSTFYCANCQK